jgi:RNA polymerase sigma factor (sigma-70 family)
VNPEQVATLEAHMPTVERMASRLSMKHRAPVEDLVSAGRVGLAEAVRRHDGRNEFKAFAFFYIRGHMMDFIRWRCRPMHPPQIHATCAPGALPDSTDSHEAGIDQKEQVAVLMSRLPQRLQSIIRMRFFECLTLREIGERLGVSKARASDLVRHAIKTIQRRAGNE